MNLVSLTFLLGFIGLVIFIYEDIRTRVINLRNKLGLGRNKDEERKREEELMKEKERKMNEKYEQEGKSAR